MLKVYLCTPERATETIQQVEEPLCINASFLALDLLPILTFRIVFIGMLPFRAVRTSLFLSGISPNRGCVPFHISCTWGECRYKGARRGVIVVAFGKCWIVTARLNSWWRSYQVGESAFSTSKARLLADSSEDYLSRFPRQRTKRSQARVKNVARLFGIYDFSYPGYTSLNETRRLTQTNFSLRTNNNLQNYR